MKTMSEIDFVRSLVNYIHPDEQSPEQITYIYEMVKSNQTYIPADPIMRDILAFAKLFVSRYDITEKPWPP